MGEQFWLALVVTLNVWLTPLPQHTLGKLVLYGNQNLVEANAEYRGYDLKPYWKRCGVAAMSPSDLGKMVWMRDGTSRWVGPCLVVDVAARHHFARAVWYVKEVLEVPTSVQKELGFEYGEWGEVWVGACPPKDPTTADPYLPDLSFEPEGAPLVAYSMYPYPAQELPEDCN